MNSKYRFYPNVATGFLSDEDTKKYFSRMGFAVFGFILASSLSSAGLSLLYTELAKRFYPTLVSNTSYWMIAANIISLISIYCIGLPIFLVVSNPLPKVTPFKAKMDIKSWIGGFFIAMLFLSIGNYISNVILISIESMMNITTSNPVGEMVGNSDIWTTIIFTVILAPILEEIVFRKLICDRLLPLGEGYAIFVSAAIFGLVHGNFYQFAYAFLLGAFFAFIYVKTGKLIYSCILHIFVNFTGLILAPAIVNAIDATELEAILESGSIDPNSPIFSAIYLLMFYSLFSLVMNIIGIFLLSKAFKKKKMTLESGLLPPPKENRFSNFFLSTGVALAIAFFVILFVLTLLEPVLTPMIESYIGGTL